MARHPHPVRPPAAGAHLEHRTSAPYYPQGNGKAEAFIETLTRERLDRQSFDSLAELQAALERYLTYYYNYRVHSALGWQPPVMRCYGPSFCDLPIPISPLTAARSRALARMA